MTWAEFGSNIAQNPISIIAILIILILVIFGVKSGWFKYNGKGLQIGGDDKERRILRDQFTYARTRCEAFIKHPIFKQFDETRVKYIAGKACNCIEDAILYNHLTTDGSYIEIKADLIYSEILKRSHEDFVNEESFKLELRKNIEDLFKKLINIRRSYESGVQGK